MRFYSTALAICMLFAVGSTTALADGAAEAASLKSLFENPKLDPATFTPAFAAAIPLDGVQDFIDSYKAHFGPPTAFDRDGFQFRIKSAKGSIGCDIALDQQGRVSSLLFHDEMSAEDLAALRTVMVAPAADPSMFEETFTQNVPVKRVDDVITGLRSHFGGFERVETRKNGYFVVFERGQAHAQISVDPSGKIDYLSFTEY